MTLSFKEDHISQIPAIKLLSNIGWQFLSRSEVESLRGGNSINTLLEPILAQKIRELNGGLLTDVNINNIITQLKAIPVNEGYVGASEKVYNNLTLGIGVELLIEGSRRTINAKLIDWKEPKNNSYHIAEEFEVVRAGRSDTYRPDLVLFVNGIPLVIIECKRPDIKNSISQAISQHIRNQQEDGIRSLYYYAGLLLSVNTNEAKYATIKSPEKFWSVWREQLPKNELEKYQEDILHTVNLPFSEESSKKLFGDREYSYTEQYFRAQEKNEITPTPQDATLFSLCQPHRVLDLIYSYTLFDNDIRKVARYQQFFAIKKTMQRITPLTGGKRRGGVIWHTQGSGKSLTMVMLSRAIVDAIHNPKIVLVTDRTDLDKQITGTFKLCSVEVENATTGTALATMLERNSDAVITTLVHKFRTAVKEIKTPLTSPNIFVIIDEAHRSQYGPMSVEINKALPNACFVVMTGTPLMGDKKNTVARFGELIEPAYTVRQAVADGTVVPLLYEGRHVDQNVDSNQIDKYFDLITTDFTEQERADFKRKFSSRNHLNIAEQKVYAIAWDISLHFEKFWKNTGFKAQLVCQSKTTAIKYKKYLDEIGKVTSEVVISAPDSRDDEYDVHESSTAEVKKFWASMMDQFGTPKKYEEGIINRYKNSDSPEIIIVVSKLTTGFDAPQNTILYLTKRMQNHELLQTTARVNRVCEGKDFGYIVDYYGVLAELYDALALYSDDDVEDIKNTFTDISTEVDTLAQKHSNLWGLFKTVKNSKDPEAYQQLLSDIELRTKFYELLTSFSKSLKISLSSIEFHNTTSEKDIERYKKDAVMFLKLRRAVQERYSETIDYKKYDAKIQSLIDRHVPATSVEIVTELVNIFDKEKFEEEVEKLTGAAAKADTIASRTKKYITEKLDEDPAFYKKFSKMLEDVINEYRQDRDAEKYLLKTMEIMESVRSHTDSDIPQELLTKDAARAFYGINFEYLKGLITDITICSEVAKDTAMHIDEIITSKVIIDWSTKKNIIDMIMLEIEDYYVDEICIKHQIETNWDEIEHIGEECINVAKRVYK